MLRYTPVILVVVLFIYGLIDCIRSEPADVRSIPKPAWLLVIVLLPLVGVILWFFLGRPRYAAVGGSTYQGGPSASARGPRFKAPDDDPEFLRTLEVTRAHQAEAERLRKLKAEHEAAERQKAEQDKAVAERLRKLKGEHEDHPNDENQR